MKQDKHARADVRRLYSLKIEIGLIVSIGLCLIAFKLDWNPAQAVVEFVQQGQEIIHMEEVLQTRQIEQPPPPPRPPIPIEVPDDTILEDDALDLDASLDIGEPIQNLTPPPPPPPTEEKEEETEPEIFIVVEEMPEIIGGIAAVQREIRYPVIASKAGVEGRVIVQFVVDEEGRVIYPVVVRGIGAGCDEEALRAVQTATFKPGRQRGKPVRVKMSLPITFKLT
jgi:protein TonB